VSPAGECGEELLFDDLQSRALYESGEDIDMRGCSDSQRQQFPQRRVRVSGRQHLGRNRRCCACLWCECSIAEIIPEFRDDIADPATWIGLITVIARDDVYVQVRNRLPGGRSAVEADIVAVGCGLQ